MTVGRRTAIGAAYTFALACLSARIAADPVTLEEGKPGRFEFVDRLGNADRPIPVWYHRPAGLAAEAPVLFVLHGVHRTAEAYRDSWVKVAERRRALLLVPEFSAALYPSDWYPLGNVAARGGNRPAESTWTFTAIEHLFDQVRSCTNLRSPQFLLYGHSAGGQFVHRMILFRPDAPIRRAVAANAGWYLFPSFDAVFPYGLKGSGLGLEQVRRALGRPLIVLLGERDTDEEDPNLRRTAQAASQGRNRLERGRAFLHAAAATAARIRSELRWSLRVVPGVGHSNTGMTPAAEEALFAD